MSGLQSIPLGYLSLLGIKDAGNPGQGADFLQPTLELGALYLAPSLTSASATTAGATGVGAASIIVVPAGEAWRLLAFGLQADTASAPLNLLLGFDVIDPIAGVPVPIGAPVSSALAIGGILRSGVLLHLAPVFPPGTSLRVILLSDIAAATFNLTSLALFQRLVV